MKKTLILLITAISATAIMFSACTSDADTGAQQDITSEQTEQDNQGGSGQNQDQKEDEKGAEDASTAGETSDDQAVIEEFEDLINGDKSPEDLLAFLHDNASKASNETISHMLLKTEEIQKEYIVKLEEMYFVSDIQEQFWTQYKEGAVPQKLKSEEVKDSELKELLQKTILNGYRLETAEGSYFPIIDYRIYKDFVSFATDDIAAYFNIMERESERAAAKDAALVIAWEEILERALAQESFIKSYPDSRRLDEVKTLFNNYKRFTFYGLDNTPLFEYSGKLMIEEARESYKKAVESFGEDEESEYIRQIADFIKLLEKSSFKLTSEVDAFRKNVVS